VRVVVIRPGAPTYCQQINCYMARGVRWGKNRKNGGNQEVLLSIRLGNFP